MSGAQYGSMDTSELLRYAASYSDELKEKAKRGIRDAAQFILGEAVDIVPLDKGDLSNSGRVVINDNGLGATVVFDTPYAAEQHENLTFRHSPGRQAKYLERPLTEHADTVKQIIANRMTS